ncbi:signal peptidase I [Nocardioides immobilis]|uniref:signal peptidase I n=1 Tax=Nocardioides immobilis TaxID=2049295 RepID=UPI0015F9DEDE|nr:signal peptidase I [Nocardioides immobilis]
MTGRLRAAGRIAGSTALNLGAALGLLVLAALVAGVAFGVRPIVITSGSMEPSIGTGALVLARTVPASDVEVGDVVTVPTASGTRVTHRVVQVDDGGAGLAVLTLRGDANATPDAEQYPVSSADRMLLDVPLVGYVLGAMRSPAGLVVVGGLAALLLVLIVGPRGRDRGGRDGPGGPRGSGRHRAPHAAIPAGKAAAGALTTLSAAAVLAVPSSAAWTDGVDVSGTTLAAYDVPKPAIQSCTVTGPALGQKSATIVWPEVSSPYPIVYTARIVETGQAMTVTDNGTTRQTVFSAGLLGTVVNQTYNVRITASLPAPGTSWTDTANQPVTVGSLGLSLTCGVAS